MCFNFLFLSVFVYFLLNHSNAQEERTYFRSDYQFVKERQAFYKLHTNPKTWANAKLTCENEGAKFFYPKNYAEARDVISFCKDVSSTWEFIYIGISALVVKGIFVTIDGIPIANVYNVWQSGEPNDVNGEEDCVVFNKKGEYNDDSCTKLFQFVCKKSRSELGWNKPCNIPNLDYVYNKEEGKCYKFYQTAMNWTDAYTTCNEEKSYLAVINSKRERDHLLSLVGGDDTKILPKGTIHIGFHNRLNEGWKTLQGTSVADNGYADWDLHQPDGYIQGEKCGSMTYNGHLHDVQCNSTSFFICEHDVQMNAY